MTIPAQAQSEEELRQTVEYENHSTDWQIGFDRGVEEMRHRQSNGRIRQ
jgi:hypothetical protein